MYYELHLTTAPDADIYDWEKLCEVLEIKPLLIELEGGGDHPRQIMFAAVGEFHQESEAWDWVKRLKHIVTSAGFPIVRSKLEVPLDKAAAWGYPHYHEAHVKSLIPEANIEELVAQARSLGWVASRNGLYTHEDGLEKWYFTKRAYKMPYLEAGKLFKEAFAQLPDDGWHTVRMEMETVIADSNEELDAGWVT